MKNRPGMGDRTFLPLLVALAIALTSGQSLTAGADDQNHRVIDLPELSRSTETLGQQRSAMTLQTMDRLDLKSVVENLVAENKRLVTALLGLTSTIDRQTSTIDRQTSTIDRQTSTIDNQTSRIEELVAANKLQTSTIDRLVSSLDKHKGSEESTNKEDGVAVIELPTTTVPSNTTVSPSTGILVVQGRDCLDVYQSGQKQSGVYHIRPTGWVDTTGFEVFCDMDTDGGGWTMFQRRGQFDNPEEYFDKDWREYKSGFGDLNREFWLGNDRLSALTTQRGQGSHYELRVDLGDFNNTRRFAKYAEFRVKDERQHYQMLVTSYSGTAGDSLASHKRVPFSTRDRGSCASVLKSGWWFRSCKYSNLNGTNKKGAFTGDRTDDGIIWYRWKGGDYSLAFSEMKIRPRQEEVAIHASLIRSRNDHSLSNTREPDQ